MSAGRHVEGARGVAALRGRPARDQEQRRLYEKERREREAAEWRAEQQRLIEAAAKRAELEDLALRLYAAQQARLARDDEDMVVLLLAA